MRVPIEARTLVLRLSARLLFRSDQHSVQTHGKLKSDRTEKYCSTSVEAGGRRPNTFLPLSCGQDSGIAAQDRGADSEAAYLPCCFVLFCVEAPLATQPAERYFHLSLASLSLLVFSSSLSISIPCAILSSRVSTNSLTFHAIAATAP